MSQNYPCLFYKDAIKLLKVENIHQSILECRCILWQEPYDGDSVWWLEKTTWVLCICSHKEMITVVCVAEKRRKYLALAMWCWKWWNSKKWKKKMQYLIYTEFDMCVFWIEFGLKRETDRLGSNVSAPRRETEFASKYTWASSHLSSSTVSLFILLFLLSSFPCVLVLST